MPHSSFSSRSMAWGGLLIAGAAVVAAFYYFLPQRSGNPQVTVSDFYATLLSKEDSYLGGGEYKKFPELTSAFIAKVDALVAGFHAEGYDPFLCAQDKPQSFSVQEEETTSSTSRFTVTEDFAGKAVPVEVSLVREAGEWKISDIRCSTGSHEGNTDELSLVGEYVRAHLSQLSPEKEVLGGKFFVTSINFEGEKGTVNYEDGHNAYVATFSYVVGQSGDVQIADFKIVEPKGSTEALVGIMVKYEGAESWSLIYEEPGKPALYKMLNFSDSSICMYEGKSTPCSSFVFAAGDYVRVEGTSSEKSFTVEKLIKLP